MLLYINKQLVDLDSNQTIAQTKQVNDLNSLENRQTNYTNKFRLPKTANNIRIMDFLTLAGNNSDIPYQKNECSLFSDNGECFVYNGWAVITDGGDSFDAVIYDGIIDLYKAIENKNLSSLVLKEIEHAKDLDGVADTWNPAHESYGKCRYILADYNGKTGYTRILNTTYAGIDYLMPSVNVAWLWDKIFTTYGVAYSGSVFQTQQFKNLWMTYPKGLITRDDGTEIVNLTSFSPANSYYGNVFDYYWRTFLFKFAPENTDYQQYFDLVGGYAFKAKEAGHFKLSIKCKLNTKDSVRIFISKNINTTNSPTLDTVVEHKVITANLPKNTDFEGEAIVKLNASESLSLLMRHRDGTVHAVRFSGDSEIDVTLTKINPAEIQFSEAFEGFSIREFLSEVLHRFGLTLFRDKYANSYEFLTMQEILQSPDTVDLSSKFAEKTSENYIYGSYAQNNWFRYAYNDKENTHNDGYIPVRNLNLPEGKDIIKSKIYSPQKEKSSYLGTTSNVYKLWEKEIDDGTDGTPAIQYKALDNRFYFLRSEFVNDSIRLRFLATQETRTQQSYWKENFWKLSFEDIVADYYRSVGYLLNKSQVVAASLLLNDNDIANFDFRKLYYIEQLGGYFLMNKISNYVPGKPVKCELVRISSYSPDTTALPKVSINKVVTNNHYIDVSFTTEGSVQAMALNISKLSGEPMPGRVIDPSASRVTHAIATTGSYNISITADGYTTAPVRVNIPSYSSVLLS
ncbi:MAG: hypothetical protein DI539_00210 [Flavobacterium psychrophilum]|nr:MAG: hypothetical protein DI539_00210 [Flavobacterium psychrophilum]